MALLTGEEPFTLDGFARYCFGGGEEAKSNPEVGTYAAPKEATDFDQMAAQWWELSGEAWTPELFAPAAPAPAPARGAPGVPTLEEEEAAELDRIGVTWEARST